MTSTHYFGMPGVVLPDGVEEGVVPVGRSRVLLRGARGSVSGTMCGRPKNGMRPNSRGWRAGPGCLAAGEFVARRRAVRGRSHETAFGKVIVEMLD